MYVCVKKFKIFENHFFLSKKNNIFEYVITHSGFLPPLYLFKKSFLLKGQVLFLSRRSYLFFDILVGC